MNRNSRITSVMNNYQYASKGSNWVKFTNGLIIQWGRTNTSTVTYGTPFTQNNYGISAVCNYTRKTSDGHGFLNTPTLTNIQLAGVDGDMYPVYWVAIGY